MFYNYYSNKFVSSYDIQNLANFKISFNDTSQSYLQYITNNYGTNINYTFGGYTIGPTTQWYGGVGLISGNTGILLRKLQPALIIAQNSSVLCEFVLGNSSYTIDLTSSSFLKSQILGTGAYYQMWSELRKKNIQIKNNNNVLNRLLNLKIHWYILNDESLYDRVIVG